MRRAGIKVGDFLDVNPQSIGDLHGRSDTWVSQTLVRSAGGYGALVDLLTSGLDFWDVLQELGLDAAADAIRRGERYHPDAPWAQPVVRGKVS